MKGKKLRVCFLCGDEFIGYGNNPWPFGTVSKRCCDECNLFYVVPARLVMTEDDYKIIADKNNDFIRNHFLTKVNLWRITNSPKKTQNLKRK